MRPDVVGNAPGADLDRSPARELGGSAPGRDMVGSAPGRVIGGNAAEGSIVEFIPPG